MSIGCLGPNDVVFGGGGSGDVSRCDAVSGRRSTDVGVTLAVVWDRGSVRAAAAHLITNLWKVLAERDLAYHGNPLETCSYGGTVDFHNIARGLGGHTWNITWGYR